MDRRSFIVTSAAVAGSTALTGLKGFNEGPVLAVETILPAALKPGATMGLIAPGGAVFDRSDVQVTETVLKRFGFNWKHGKTLDLKHGQFAGTDEERAGDLMEMFMDPEVDAILAVRGGSGTARILPYLDYELIAQNPKVVCGFSDLTSLLWTLNAKSGLIAFHGPVGISSWNSFTWNSFQEVLINAGSTIYTGAKLHPLSQSAESISGRLVGGNLTCINQLMGTPWEMPFQERIVFIEEIAEEPYHIDRLLSQLHLSGKLENASGILLGGFNRCIAEEPHKQFTVEEVINHWVQQLSIPVMHSAKFGHQRDKITLPVGLAVRINTETGTMTLDHPTVKK